MNLAVGLGEGRRVTWTASGRRGRKTVWFRVKEGEKVRKNCSMTRDNHGPEDSSRYGMMSGKE